MKFLHKLQNLPESQRRIILWGIVIVIGVGLGAWWVKGVGERLRELKNIDIKKEFPLPHLEEYIPELPQLGLPPMETP